MKTVALDSQIFNTIMACGRKYKLEHLENFRPFQKAEALEKGDLMHKMLAHYYRQKMQKRSDWNAIVQEAMDIARKASVDMDISNASVEEDIKQFIAYCDFHHHDGWEPLIVEHPFSKVLYSREDTPQREGLTILWEGIIDLVIRDPHNERWVVDHKTASRRGKVSPLSAQFMGYSWYSGIDVIVNKIGFQKTLDEKERFKRHPLHYQASSIREWQESVVFWTHVALDYIEKDYFPPNWTSCDKYSGCIFRPVCERIPEVRDFKLASFYYKGDPWSPYTRDSEDAEEDD